MVTHQQRPSWESRQAPSSFTLMNEEQEKVKMQKMCRRPLVEEITGLSRSSIYAMVAKGTFPRPIRLGKRAVAWREQDIREWMESRKHV